jgi:hypothetical protein
MKRPTCACLFLVSNFSLAATFTVTTANDSGPGSLHEAMGNANTNVGLDTIAFNLAGPPYTIFLGQLLPVIQEGVVIDGYTQPGASANTLSNGNNAVLLVELTTTNSSVITGIGINSGGCTVRGLVINGFPRAISMQHVGGNVIEGNFLGLDPSGTNASPRATGTGIQAATTNNLNRIGGLAPAARNLIAGTIVGLEISGGTSVNTVQGNYIGTDRHGTRVISNANYGITLQSSGNLIGGSTPAARNLIAGSQTGLLIASGASRFNVVQGNFIGTDVTGTAALPNILAGISVSGQSNVVGGVTLAPGQPPGNLISGNVNRGLELAGSDHIVQGNLIGTDLTGTLRLANGTDGLIPNASRTLVGGTNTGEGNVISGNVGAGVNLSSSGGATNVFAGNWIGTDVTGTLNLSNGSHGIRISGARSCTVGPGNVIAFNGGNGVAVQSFTATENWITANAIFLNAARGIDLANGNVLDGVSANDACDADSSLPNQWQNYPVLTNAVSAGASTIVEGYLPSTAHGVFQLEFFASATCDASGSGEGQTHLGAILVTNAASCTNSFSALVPVGFLGGKAITVTATDTNRNTSEFSACLTATGTAAAPVLTMVPAGAAQVQVSWAPNSPGWILQETWVLSPANWTNAPSGATNPVVVPATVPTKFYRLFKP